MLFLKLMYHYVYNIKIKYYEKLINDYRPTKGFLSS
mgnify:CR=1 FL=1